MRSVRSCLLSVALLYLGVSLGFAQSITPPQPTMINLPTPTLGTNEPAEVTTHEKISLATGAVSFFLPVVSLPQRGGASLDLGFVLDGSTYAQREPYNVYQNYADTKGDLEPSFTTIQNAPTVNSVLWGVGTILHANIPNLTADLSYVGLDTYNLCNPNNPQENCSPADSNLWENMPEYCMQNWTFTDWDGSVHNFNGTRDCSQVAHQGGSLQNDGFWDFAEYLPLKTKVSQSMDDGFYYLDATNSADIKVIRRDGTVYHFTGYQNGYVSVWPQIAFDDKTFLHKYSAFMDHSVDVNGNAMSYASGVLTDTLGRQINIAGTSISYKAMDGTSASQVQAAVVRTQHDSSTWPIQYPNGSGGCRANYVIPNGHGNHQTNITYWGPENGTGEAFLDTYQISLPRGVLYTLSFDVAGNLTKIVYPGGGYTKYDHLIAGGVENTQNFGDVTCLEQANKLLAKHECTSSSGACSAASTVTSESSCVAGWPTGGEATTCYSGLYGALQPGVNGQSGVLPATVIDPYGNKTVHYNAGNQVQSSAPAFNYIIGSYETGEDDYEGSTLRRSIRKDFGDSSTGCASANVPFNTQPCNVTTIDYTSTGSLSRTTKYTYDFSGSGYTNDGGYWYYPSITSIQEYGYSGELLRSTSATWDHDGIYAPGAPGSTGVSNLREHLASVTSTDPVSGASNTKTFTYDALGNLQVASLIGSDSATPMVTDYRPLDTYGRPIQKTDPNGNVTKYSYNTDAAWDNTACSIAPGTSAYLASITNALNQTTSIKYNSCTGSASSITDPNGNTTKFYYEPLGRVQQLVQPDGGSTSAQFIDTAPISITTTKVQSPNPSVVTSIIFDGFARPRQTQLQSDPYGTVYTDTTYDALGRVSTVTNPYRTDSGTTSSAITQTFYDSLSRKTRRIQPDGSGVEWCYNGTSDPAHPQSNCNGSSMSPLLGAWVDSKDESGADWQRISDGAGELVGVVEPSGAKTAYTYDGWGNLLTANQYGSAGASETTRSHSFSYDSLSRILTSTNPETGTICYGQWNFQQVMGQTSRHCLLDYDLNGNLLHKGDNNGVETEYHYDALNRLTHAWSTDYTLLVDKFYDTQPNGIGRLGCEANWNAGNMCYAYDAVGRIAYKGSSSYANADPWYGFVMLYDLAGNVTDMYYPDSRHVTQTWDGAGRLSKISSNGTDFISGTNGAVQYSAAGSPTNIVYGNGIVQNLLYNSRLQPCRVSASTLVLPAASTTGSGNVFDRSAYFSSQFVNPCEDETGNNGNIYSIVDNLSVGQSESFGYDNLNRLTSTLRSDGAFNENYHYDSFGNLLIDTSLNPSLYSQTWIDPTTNRLYRAPSGIKQSQYNVYVYDNAGNLTSSGTSDIGGHSFTYNAQNQITSVDGNAAQYYYSADGQREFKFTPASSNPTEYVFAQNGAIAELDPSGNWTDYIVANGQKIAKLGGQKQVHFTGTNTATCNAWYFAGYHFNLGGITVQAGDTLSWMQYQSGGASPRGGVSLLFSDGTYSNWVMTDQNSEIMNSLSVQNAWVKRVVDLSSKAGLSVSASWLAEDAQSGAGDWDERFADLALTRTDGTVMTLFNGQDSFGTDQFNQCTTNTNVAVDQMDANAPGNTHYYVDDHLGTTQVELSSGGWPVWKGQFTPFGQEIDNGATAMHYKFTGKERDTESGLDYFKYRMYASSMGRWMSPDPSGLTHADLGNPQSLNLYNYVGNSPLTRTDLDGLCWKGFQWACNAAQSLNNGFHGLGFQTNASVDREQHRDNQLLHHDGIQTEGMSRQQVRKAYKLDMALGSVTSNDTGLRVITRTRPSAAQARAIWEKATGGKVPWDETMGRYFDMAHRQAIGDGGDPKDPNNLFPQQHDEHVEFHRQNGDFSRWGARGAQSDEVPADMTVEPAPVVTPSPIVEPIDPIP